jgi:hypothetical protein
MHFSNDGLANVIESRNRQYAKHLEQRISTPVGITIERNDDDSNADDSIRLSDDGCSNVIESRVRQFAKHFEQRISTPDEIITGVSHPK